MASQGAFLALSAMGDFVESNKTESFLFYSTASGFGLYLITIACSQSENNDN